MGENMKEASDQISGLGHRCHKPRSKLELAAAHFVMPLVLGISAHNAFAQQVPSAQFSAAEGQVLPTVSVSADAERFGTTEGTGSYTTDSMSTATRLNLSIRETPQSVSVITREQMDDLNILSVEDMVNITPGLTLNRGTTERGSFYSRGFPISFFTEDGLPFSSDGDTMGFATLAMYDRVEVLRGTSGMLTGAGNPSGALNFVRKRPTADPKFSASASLGRWDNYRAQIDASGPLNEAKTLRGRAVVAYQDTDTYISNYGHERSLVYATAEADLTRDTTLSVGFHYNREQNNGSTWYGLPTARNGQFLPLSRSTTNSPDWGYWDKTNTRVFAELEHRFANRWKAKLAVQSRKDELDSRVTEVARVGTSNQFMLTQTPSFIYDRDQRSIDIQASGPFTLFGQKHEMVVGANYRTRDTDDRGYRPFTPINFVFDPTNWDSSAPLDQKPVNYFYGSFAKTKQTGVYTTARFKVTEPLALLVGARVDDYEHDVRNYSQLSTPQNSSSGYKINSEVTPYAGVVLDLNDTYSLYGSYTSIFNPQTQTDADGNVLDPVQGINTEVGIKGEYFGGALNVSAAVFRIKQQNLATALVVSECKGRPSCSEAAGEVQSEGFELEIAGSLTPNWQLSAGYTYNTAEYTKRTGSNLPGSRYAADRPSRLFRLATSYKLPGELNQWRIGGAIRAQNEIYKTNNLIRQGGYTIADIWAAYQVNRNWDLRFNVSNLFDKNYYQTIGSVDSGNAFGEPRNFFVTANYKF
jgi:outer membrane receptor for ferric coprogen and ferric-rhodotorulic acid